ncbi:MAG TPA: hypothetical protein DDW50_02600 [Firmicutes bacterium]|nr:hypothetical protein [Bacillota bacterium]
MVELFLFLAVICMFFFLPVQFRISYQKIAWDDTLVLEMSFLHGLLKRRRLVSLLQLTPKGIKKQQKNSGRWFFFRRILRQKMTTPYQGNSSNWRGFFQRYQQYGLGMTMLTYFLPAKYHRWLFVVEDLEHRGHFTKFTWITRIGTGNPVSTATIYGVLWGVKSSLLSYLYRKEKLVGTPDIQVIPDFQTTRLDLNFDCIFKVKLGYIIIAAFVAHFRHRMMKGGIGFGRSPN